MLSRFEQFSFVISSIHRCIQKIERDEMLKYGCKGAYAQYLLAMQRTSEGVTLSRLCEVCDKNKAAVSRAVKEMEEKGLLVREAKAANAYRAKLKLTEKGQAAAAHVCDRAKTAVVAAGKGLSDRHRQIFYAALSLISDNLRSMSEDGIPDDNN